MTMNEFKIETVRCSADHDNLESRVRKHEGSGGCDGHVFAKVNKYQV